MHRIVVRELWDRHLQDVNTMNVHNMDEMLCRGATYKGLVDLVEMLVADFNVQEFDVIVEVAIAFNQVAIMQWLFVDYKHDTTIQQVLIIMTKWLCFPYRPTTGHKCNTYDDNLLKILLKKASISVVKESYLLTNDNPNFYSFSVLCCRSYATAT